MLTAVTTGCAYEFQNAVTMLHVFNPVQIILQAHQYHFLVLVMNFLNLKSGSCFVTPTVKRCVGSCLGRHAHLT